MTKPKIAVVALGKGATHAMSDLIPTMPDTKFIAYADDHKCCRRPNTDTSNFHLFINTALKHRIYPYPTEITGNDRYSFMARSFVGVTTWNGKAIQDDHELWFWATEEDSWRAMAGRGGLALVKDGKIIDSVISIVN